MIYILRASKKADETYNYIMYHALIDTAINGTFEDIKNILENNVSVVNAKLVNGQVCFDSKLLCASFETYYILVSNYSENQYKLVRMGAFPDIDIVNKDTLIERIRENKVLNCRLYEHDETRIEAYGTYDVEITEDFKSYIKNEYTKYITKSKLIGRNTEFEYEIEGNEVILKRYIGEDDNVIIPHFITAIGNNAFINKKLKNINLNNGLKVIGKGAFYMSKLDYVEIPETVQLICNGAFTSNKLTQSGNIMLDKVKYKSNKTVILQLISTDDVDRILKLQNSLMGEPFVDKQEQEWKIL